MGDGQSIVDRPICANPCEDSVLRTYLEYIQSKIPMPQSLELKAGQPTTQFLGLIGVMQVKI